jgi:hypothetical protein
MEMNVTILEEGLITEGYKDWTAEDLKAMKQDQLMQLYLTLPCPTMQEMEGEFKGYLMDTGNFWIIKKPLAFLVLDYNIFYRKWLGKGFTNTSETEGHGYNSYRKSGKVIHVLPFKTCISRSIYDGKDVIELDYTVYGSPAGYVDMIDEVRKVNDELYLGIGNWGYFKKMRMIPNFFALAGPRGPYAGVDKQHRDRRRRFPK